MGLKQISSQRFLMWQTASIRSYQRELTAQGNPEEQIFSEKMRYLINSCKFFLSELLETALTS